MSFRAPKTLADELLILDDARTGPRATCKAPYKLESCALSGSDSSPLLLGPGVCVEALFDPSPSYPASALTLRCACCDKDGRGSKACCCGNPGVYCEAKLLSEYIVGPVGGAIRVSETQFIIVTSFYIRTTTHEVQFCHKLQRQLSLLRDQAACFGLMGP